MNEQLEQVREQSELVRIVNAASYLTNFETQKYYQNERKFNVVKINEGHI